MGLLRPICVASVVRGVLVTQKLRYTGIFVDGVVQMYQTLICTEHTPGYKCREVRGSNNVLWVSRRIRQAVFTAVVRRFIAHIGCNDEITVTTDVNTPPIVRQIAHSARRPCPRPLGSPSTYRASCVVVRAEGDVLSEVRIEV